MAPPGYYSIVGGYRDSGKVRTTFGTCTWSTLQPRFTSLLKATFLAPSPGDLCAVNQSQLDIRKKALGSRLHGKVPQLLDAVGDLLPDREGLGVLKLILDKDDQLSPEDKEQLEMMIAQRNELEHEITARWQADAKSTWLASNVRPLIVLILVATLLLFIILDSMDLAFTIRDAWISLYEVLTLTAVGGYFTLCSVVDMRLKP